LFKVQNMKKAHYKSVLICFFIINLNFAQTWQWAIAGNGPFTIDEASGCATDASGNVFITGNSQSQPFTLGSQTITSPGYDMPYIAKIDPNGNTLWIKNSGGAGVNSFRNSICTDPNGNAIITGNFYGTTITFGSYTLASANASTEDLYVVKYDPSGNVLWAKQAGGNSNDLSYSVTSDLNGNVYLTGYFRSPTIVFGSYTLTNSGLANVFIVKYDPSGNVIWAKSAGDLGFDVGSAVTTDSNGNVYLSGQFSSSTITFGSTVLLQTGANNMFLVKYDSSGNVLWAKRSVSAGNINISGITADPLGNLYLIGHTANGWPVSFDSYSDNSSVQGNAFFVKYNNSGNALWVKSVSANSSKGWAICSNVNSVNIIGGFTGTSISFGAINVNITSSLSDPLYIATYDLNGNAVFGAAFEYGGNDQSGICVDNFCNVFVTGENSSPTFSFSFGSITLPPLSHEDVFVAKLSFNCPITGIELASKSNENISIFPNPNNGAFTININNEIQNGEFVLINSLGQKIYSQKIERGINNLSVNDVSDGLYHYYILQNKQQQNSGNFIIKKP
jgi:hypothetical protein